MATPPLNSTKQISTILGLSAVVFFLAAAVVGLSLKEPRDQAASGIPPVSAAAAPVITPPPLPTEINANFLAQVENCLLPVASAYGYTLRLTSGYRTVEEQDKVFQQGRTENGHIVTEVAGGRSLHNFGLAVDVVDRYRGYDIDWDRLGRIGAYCGLEQNDEGDQAHFTHRAGLTIEQLAAGERPPTLVLPCARLVRAAGSAETLTRADLEACGAPGF